MRGGLLKGEGGFTLPEVLVSMVLMATVLFALYAVFDATVRVFAAGGGRLEDVREARLGLARIERELRAAYPADKTNGDVTLLASFGEDHVTFGNDLDGNRRTRDPATGAWDAKERISFALDDGGTPLRNGVPLVGSMTDATGDGRTLFFEYFDANGVPVTSGEETEVALVRVSLRVSVGRNAGGEGPDRVLRTSIALRNR